MEPAPTLEAWKRAPAGRSWRGDGWLTFCARLPAPGLWGFAVHGHVGAAAAAALVEAIRVELDDAVAPHRSLIDARRLTGVEPRSFDAFSAYVQAHHVALGRQVTSLAIVRPPGLEGAVVAGFFQVLPPPYPVTIVDSVTAGLVALGEDPAAHADLQDTLDTLDAEDEAEVLIGRLVALCHRQPRLELDEAAPALGVGTRTLQRRLGEAGTSFSAVVASARLKLAIGRIEGGDDALTTIALESGFASLQHLGGAVKKATGRTPSQLRAAARA